MSKRFIGMDLSLCETGLVILNENVRMTETKIIKTTSKDVIESRFDIILESLDFIKDFDNIEMVHVEGLALNTKNAKKFEMGALHHMVRFMLYKECIQFSVIGPKVLKKWMTGNGNASKDLMKDVCHERFGIRFKNDNLCDAYGLAAMALENYLRGNKNVDE